MIWLVLMPVNERDIIQLTQMVYQLANRVKAVEDNFRLHIGNTGVGFNSPNLPHPNMSAIKQGTYTITNQANDRTYDANASSTDELADVLSQVIADLQRIGILG